MKVKEVKQEEVKSFSDQFQVNQFQSMELNFCHWKHSTDLSDHICNDK